MKSAQIIQTAVLSIKSTELLSKEMIVLCVGAANCVGKWDIEIICSPKSRVYLDSVAANLGEDLHPQITVHVFVSTD